MGDDPERDSQQQAIDSNNGSSTEETVVTGVAGSGAHSGDEHGDEPRDASVQAEASGSTNSAKELSIDTQTPPHEDAERKAEVSEGQHNGEPHEDGGLEGSTLSTPVETPSATSEHASTSASAHATGMAHPGPPKKFVSSANINKKFLQKTATPTPPPAPGKGVVPTIARPASITPTQSQSRLVTTKLTMVAPSVSTPSAGWKSNTPSGAPSPQPAATPAPAQGQSSVSGSAGPGTVGPAAALQAASAKLATSMAAPPRTTGVPAVPAGVVPMSRAPAIVQMQKPAAPTVNAWGHPVAAAPTSAKPALGVEADFPTAAEAARGKRPRVGPSHKAEARPPALADTSADAFRGVHLDPNAHHWDEMEDEEDDFLAGEVEFGDGRQYKVEAAEAEIEQALPATAIPVPREERFSDDFDRSWPRTAPLPPAHDTNRHAPPHLSPSATSPRALFNERSNRLEPWGRPGTQHQQHPPGRRRESFDDHRGGFPGRDAPPHTGIHVLQKEPRSGSFAPREPQPLPPHPHTQRRPSQSESTGRQLPPHIAHPAQSREPLPAVGSGRPQQPLTTSSESDSAVAPSSTLLPPPPHLATSISTAPDSASLKSLSPDAASSPALPISAVDVGELHRLAMHSAAERAKRRRQEEEEERERERERARRKAQELEERIKAAELEKQKEAERQKEAGRQKEAARMEEERKAAELQQKVSERKGAWQAEPPKPAQRESVQAIRPPHAAPARPGPGPTQSAKSPDAPSMRADSWRSAKPPGPVTVIAAITTVPPPPASASSSSPPVIAKARSPIVSTVPEVLAISSADDVEEVDFAEMGRLSHSNPSPAGPSQHVQAPSRERAHPVNVKDETGPWRRGQSSTVDATSAQPAMNGTARPIPIEPESFSTLPSEVFVLDDEPTSIEETPVPRVSVPSPAGLRVASQQQQPHAKHAYREPALSALDDTMSRIKGALGAMQEARGSGTGTKITISPPAIPPVVATSLTVRPLEATTHIDRPVSPPLVWRSFTVRIPKKSIKRDAVPPSRLQEFLQIPPPASMDILCWVPPVKDMSIRTLSRDDLFHRKTYTRGVVNARVHLPSQRFVQYVKPPPQPIVRLPSTSSTSVQDHPVVASSLPRVLLPKSRMPSLAPRDVPPEARQHFVDSLSRAPAGGLGETSTSGNLNLTSRSPPPDITYPLSPPSDALTSARQSTDKAFPATAPRVPRKMPEGVNLVLYKSPSRTDVTTADTSTVRFTVSSELDAQTTFEKPISVARVSPRKVTLDLAGESERNIRVNDRTGDAAVRPIEVGTSTKSSDGSMSSLLSSVGALPTSSTSMPSPEIDLSKPSSNDGPTKSSVTPGSGATPNPWGKAILPDPEHLKAVWSHPGTSKITENSLKGIADEFPASLPVSVQELRSEEEDVPGVKNADELPTPAVAETPVRPSFFDPHKSFQQVPAQPSSSSSRFVPPPPVNYSAPAIHPPTSYSSLGAAGTIRPGAATHAAARPFPSYAPIVPGHSPSPPIMYPTAAPYSMVSQSLGQTMSPSMPQRLWVPQQASPAASYVTTSTQYTPGMMPYGTAGTVGGVARPYQPMQPTSKAPGGERPMLMHTPNMPHASTLDSHVSPSYHSVGGMEQMPGFSPPVHNALPQTHVGFAPQQANPSQQMYSVPIGGGRGAVRNAYDGYQPVPSGAFVRPSGW